MDKIDNIPFQVYDYLSYKQKAEIADICFDKFKEAIEDHNFQEEVKDGLSRIMTEMLKEKLL